MLPIRVAIIYQHFRAGARSSHYFQLGNFSYNSYVGFLYYKEENKIQLIKNGMTNGIKMDYSTRIINALKTLLSLRVKWHER